MTTEGLIKAGYTVSLTNGTWTAIVAPNYSSMGFYAWTNTGSGFSTSYNSDGDNPTLYTDTREPWLKLMPLKETGVDILYVKSVAATDTLNVEFLPDYLKE